MAPGKSAGSALYKVDIFRGAGALLFEVLARLFTAWARGGYPRQLNTLYLMPIYKFRGDRAECDNYRGISLLPPRGLHRSIGPLTEMEF